MQSGQLENKTISNKGLIGRDRRSVSPEPEMQPGIGTASPEPGTLSNNIEFSFNITHTYCKTLNVCKMYVKHWFLTSKDRS